MGERFTVQISSDLINMLAEQEEKVRVKKTKRAKPKKESPPQSDNSKEEVKQSIGSKSSASSAGWPLHPQLPLPFVQPPPPTVMDPEINAIQGILRESAQVMERMKKMEANMTEEVKQRAKELHDKEFKLPYQKPMPCLAEKHACLQCYKEHMNEPLKCAEVAKNFADCSRKVRQQKDLAYQGCLPVVHLDVSKGWRPCNTGVPATQASLFV